MKPIARGCAGSAMSYTRSPAEKFVPCVPKRLLWTPEIEPP